MRSMFLAIACAAGFAALGSVPSAHAAGCSKAAFCAGWYVVCKRTLPAGGSVSVCDSRRSACLSSGCFHFNSPGPRCVSNPADVALTRSCKG